MPNFKPQASFIPKVGLDTKTESFKTYAELKKNLKRMLSESFNDVVSVTRSRRGEWGEWFEKWETIKGKPTITHKGWN